VPVVKPVITAGAVAAAIAVSVAGCGSAGSSSARSTGSASHSAAAAATSASPTAPASPLAGLTPDQIVQKATNNLLATTSVDMTAANDDDGEKVLINVTIGAEGCQGTAAETPETSSTGIGASGTFAILEADGTDYVKFSRDYLESVHAPAAQVDVLAGKYVTISATSKLASIFELCDMSKIVSVFNQGEGGFVSAGSTTIDGQPALVFKQPTATPPDAVDVLNYPVPELLSIKELSSPGGYFDFTNYNAPFSVNPPSAADMVDGSQYGL
jgi:hypothetical protein